MASSSEDPINYPTLIAELRIAATLLEKFNEAYEGTMYAWSPEKLRYEADYLEKRL